MWLQPSQSPDLKPTENLWENMKTLSQTIFIQYNKGGSTLQGQTGKTKPQVIHTDGFSDYYLLNPEVYFWEEMQPAYLKM